MTGPVKTYDVEVNGYKTRMKLNDQDARRMGLLDDAPAAGQVAEPKPEPKPEPKRRAPANKARTPRDK